MSVANTILEQLGGNGFLAMTGAHHLVADGNTLRMSLPRNGSKANRLYITLDADDTYSMRFFRFTAGRWNSKTVSFTDDKITEIALIKGVYCDRLEATFTEITGLYTRMPRIIGI